jgi:hypothetical protein
MNHTLLYVLSHEAFDDDSLYELWLTEKSVTYYILCIFWSRPSNQDLFPARYLNVPYISFLLETHTSLKGKIRSKGPKLYYVACMLFYYIIIREGKGTIILGLQYDNCFLRGFGPTTCIGY